MSGLDEQTLRALFDRSQKTNPEKMQFSEEESVRFQKSFEDPEFRKLFGDYMDELQDPKNREETEAYISQLEGEQKVPEGKELIRPEPSFVAKSFKIVKKEPNDKEKVFLNIVKSEKINVPSKTTTPQGTCWSVPYSLGPPHMEKDKNGINAPCFDCCFHPDAIRLGMQHKEFKDLLVTTAMEGVEKLYQQQGQDITIHREFHIVKGLDYKQGPVPTMMIAVAAKENWNDKDTKASSTAKAVPKVAKLASAAAKGPTAPVAAAASVDLSPELEAPDVTDKQPPSKPAAGPAIKKGFLSNSKGAIYGDKLTTLRKKQPASSAAHGEIIAAPISLVDQPSTGGLNDLQVSSGAKKTGLIQEVKQGQSAPTPAASTAAKSSSSSSSVGGLTAVSTTKRTPAAAPTLLANAEATPPSGSNIASADFTAESQGEKTVTVDGLERPKYSMKERGVVSMGDFENMNNTARSNRPSELVFRVELPKILKASLIVLDIAERQLSLSYPGLYALNVTLPYTVFDTKGTAKYDKLSKSLTVTLPVRPPPASSSQPPVSPAKAVSLVDASASETPPLESETDSSSSSAAPARSSPVKKSSVGHGRWVDTAADGASAAGGGDSAAPLSLAEEIRQQAAMALREAQAAKSAAPAVKPANQASVAVAPSAAAVVAVDPSAGSGTGNYIAAASFGGRKAGYVFKRGEAGVGYYVDVKSGAPGPTATASALAAPPAATSSTTTTTIGKTSDESPPAQTAEYLSFPFQCRQTKPALALIVEVPNIDKSTLKIDFEPFAVRVSFRVFSDVPIQGDSSSSSSDGTKAATQIGLVQYGSVLRLQESECPGGLDVSQCRFDAQQQNLAIVLTKALPQYWHSQAGKPVKSDAATESKSDDITSEETRRLFAVGPLVPVAAAVSVPASVSASAHKVNAANAEVAKALKSLESTIQVMQFSSSDALFELD